MSLFILPFFSVLPERGDMEKTIGMRIKECRLALGMTQEELAEISYIPKSTLSAYERDLVDIKMGTIKELARIFHTTAGYLIDGNEPECDEDIMTMISDCETYLSSATTETEKAKLIHDFIINRIDYAYESSPLYPSKHRCPLRRNPYRTGTL